MITCLFCDLEPKVKLVKDEGMTHWYVRCPKYGFSASSFYGEKDALEHWDKCQRWRDKQVRFEL